MRCAIYYILYAISCMLCVPYVGSIKLLERTQELREAVRGDGEGLGRWPGGWEGPGASERARSSRGGE